MKKVTALTAQQKNKKRVNLYLDGEFFCSLDLFTVMSERLKVGDEVDEERLKELSENSEYADALDKAVKYISKAMHTKMQVIKYLKDKGFSGRTIAKVIDKMEEYGYVDDEAFAKAYYKEKSRLYGKRKIVYELKSKGVDEKITDKLFGDVDDEEEACRTVAEKYLKGKPLDYELKQKCYRYLISKGFDYDAAKRTLEQLEDESNNS